MPNAGAQQAMWTTMLSQAGAQNSLKMLGEGYDKARGDLTGADYYKPAYDSAFGSSGSMPMLMNGLGLNGQGGKEAAFAAFRGTNPGYGFAMDQGIQARDRSAAARGALGSGAHLMELTKYGQGLADQNYGDWLSRLGGMTQLGMTAAAGEQGRQGTLAGLDYGFGKDQAGINWNATQSAIGGIGNSLTNDAASGAQNQQNLFGGILGGLKLAAQAAPMMMALSDARAKTDIREVGRLDNGLPVYAFRYKAGGPAQIGLMAQDVVKVHPDAVGVRDDGLLAVDYARAVE